MLYRLRAPDMARRSLRPHLNQIRGWVRQGRTDAWIAHQLEVTVQDIEAFKRQNDLLPDGEAPDGPSLDFDDEIDLRRGDAPPRRGRRAHRRRARGGRGRPRGGGAPRGRGGGAPRRRGEGAPRRGGRRRRGGG